MGDTELGSSRWETFAHRRRVVLLAGADAHARLALASTEPRGRDISLPLPGTRPRFAPSRCTCARIGPLTNDATRDATTIVQALRRGHVYVAVDGIASPPSFQFTATNERGTVNEGDTLEDGGPVTLRVRSNAPRLLSRSLWRNGEPLTSARDEVDLTRSTPSGPAIYRAAITAPPELGSIPWIVGNPIYVGVSFPAAACGR